MSGRLGDQTGAPASGPIRLALTDDEPLLTAGLAMILGAQPDMEVVWEATDGATALRRAADEPVDVLLLDVQMPGMDGIEVTRRLVETGVDCRVVILTTFDTDGYVLGAIEAGAAGFLLKNTPPAQLLTAIRTVHAGDAVISPGPTRRLLTAVRGGGTLAARDTAASAGSAGSARSLGSAGATGSRAPKVRAAAAGREGAGPVVVGEAGSSSSGREPLPVLLTEREREVLRLIALGLTNQELCDRLWLSMTTVKTHVSHLLAKTGARDRVQLVLTAIRAGVVDVEDVLGGVRPA